LANKRVDEFVRRQTERPKSGPGFVVAWLAIKVGKFYAFWRCILVDEDEEDAIDWFLGFVVVVLVCLFWGVLGILDEDIDFKCYL
jgi:hypothetical protein